MSEKKIRNIAIIAHVDHGKTTLVDLLFKTVGMFRDNQVVTTCIMDKDAIESRRGITIMSKCTVIFWKGYMINILDTPGHADFGSEVERILKMVDGCLLVVDAAESVMPQTKFVLSKAMENKLKPIIFINKIDRTGATPKETANDVLDLVFSMNNDALDTPIFYGSGREGYASTNLEKAKEIGNIFELLDKIIEYIPAPQPFSENLQFLVSMIEMDEYFGKLLIGKIFSGSIKQGETVFAFNQKGELKEKFRINKMFRFIGIKKEEITEASYGEIVCIAGCVQSTVTDMLSNISNVSKADIISAPEIEPTTLSVVISANISPLAGKEGTKLTPKQIKDRLKSESESNVGIKVRDQGDSVEVLCRGELQISVLVEKMTEEGFELSISAPEIILKRTESGELQEPIENAIIDVELLYMGIVIEKIGLRGGELTDMKEYPDGRVRLFFKIPTRFLIGYSSELKSDTKGTGILNKEFIGYEKYRGEKSTRIRGILVSMASGTATDYALNDLKDRGIFFIKHSDQLYEGMIIGEHNKTNNLKVNATKKKQLTNVRAAGKDEIVQLTPPVIMSFERALTYILPGEFIEVTPKRLCMFIDKNSKLYKNL